MSTLSYKATNGNGGNTAFSIDTFSSDEIKVYVNEVLKQEGSGNDYQITGYSSTGGTVAWVGTAPTSNDRIRIVRETKILNNGGNAVEGKATFASGSALKATDLNNNTTQFLRSLQEHNDQLIQTYDLQDNAITTAKITADNITGALIADDQINSEHIVADSLDTEHYAPGSVDNTALGADCVTGSKIADDQIESEHYAPDSIDTEHYAPNSVDTAAIGASQVTTNELATDAVTTVKITNLNVTTEKLANDAVTGAKIGDDQINSEHYAAGSIDNEHIADGTIQSSKLAGGISASQLATNSVLTAAVQDGQITSAKMHPDAVITSSEQGSATTNDTSFLTSAAADARFFNISSCETIKDGDTFPDNDTTIATTAAINDRIIDIVNDVGGFDIIESEQHFPNTNPQGAAGSAAVLSVKAASTTLTPSGTTLTISNGNLANNANITITGVTAAIPSGFGFLVESTGTLHTYTFHRLVPKATEVTTVAGVASNVTTVAGIAANTTTVAGISSDVTTVAGIASNVTSVANNASNINSAVSNASNINSAVSNASNINTVAGAITNVNNVGGSITNVNTVASNLSSVNSFANQYRIGANNPDTSLDTGDLFFNTTSSSLKVYTGSAWVDGVTQTGDFALKTGNTFTGSNIHNDNVKSIYGTSSDGLEIFHDTNDSIINDTGTGSLKLQTGGSTKLEVVSGGLDVTGNITVSGNVDGRDIAADGSSLDNFEAGNVTTNVTNGNIKLTPNGTGVAEVRGVGGADGTLQLNCSQNSHGIKLKSPPHSAGASYTLTFPNTAGGASGNVLTTDGSGGLSWSTPRTTENVQDIVGAMVTGNTETGITVTYQDSDGTIDFVVGTLNQDTSGNAATATALETARTIAGTSFDGTGNIDISYANLTNKLSVGDGGLTQNNFTDALKTKLDGIATGATAVTNNNQLTNGAGYVTSNTQLSNEQVQDIVGGMVSSNTESGITVTYQDSDGTLDFSVASQTDNNFTTTLKNKLDGIAASATNVTNNNQLTNGAGYITTVADTTIAPSTIDMEDNEKIKLGTGDDLEIYHSGSQSIITDTAHPVFLKGNQVHVQSANGNMISCYQDAQVQLFFNESNKFETTTNGVKVNGGAAGNTASHSASSGAYAPDFGAAAYHLIDMNANMALNAPTNQAVGQSGSLFFTQDNSGNRAISSYDGAWKFAGGTDPVLSTANGAVDRIDYVVKASGEIHAVATLALA